MQLVKNLTGLLLWAIVIFASAYFFPDNVWVVNEYFFSFFPLIIAQICLTWLPCPGSGHSPETDYDAYLDCLNHNQS